MKIVHVAAELTPIAKVGGLGDVVQGLARIFAKKGHDVTVIIPRYDMLDPSKIENFTLIQEPLYSYWDGRWRPNAVWKGKVDNLNVYFLAPYHRDGFYRLEPPRPGGFFRRGEIYGTKDDQKRFLYFSRLVVDFLKEERLIPDVLHIHDWHTAAIAPLLKKILPLPIEKIILTIHNMAYQGKCSKKDLKAVGLESLTSELQDKTGYPNLLKGGMVFSDRINTVSPTYAKDVLTKKEGWGLEDTLLEYQEKFSGILNGLDYDYWNPQTDSHLPLHYSSEKLNAKDELKQLLRKRLNLKNDRRPLIGCVTRLVPQKGVELIREAPRIISENGGQFVLLGSTNIPKINRTFHSLKRKYDNDPNVHMTLHYDEELAHLIYAACDMVIVPSIFEPCGLTQMIALRYGTVPIVRRTGGLADTIVDVDLSGRPSSETNGFTFDAPQVASMEDALLRAITCWKNEKGRFATLIQSGMQQDFSWNRSSEDYLSLYS